MYVNHAKTGAFARTQALCLGAACSAPTLLQYYMVPGRLGGISQHKSHWSPAFREGPAPLQVRWQRGPHRQDLQRHRVAAVARLPVVACQHPRRAVTDSATERLSAARATLYAIIGTRHARVEQAQRGPRTAVVGYEEVRVGVERRRQGDGAKASVQWGCRVRRVRRSRAGVDRDGAQERPGQVVRAVGRAARAHGGGTVDHGRRHPSIADDDHIDRLVALPCAGSTGGAGAHERGPVHEFGSVGRSEMHSMYSRKGT